MGETRRFVNDIGAGRCHTLDQHEISIMERDANFAHLQFKFRKYRGPTDVNNPGPTKSERRGACGSASAQTAKHLQNIT